MELSKKQSEIFIEWYTKRYAKRDENWEFIYPVEIPIVSANKQREEVEEWVKIIKKMLWTKANKIYKYRWENYDKPETYLEKCFNSLYLNYWPTYKEDDWTPAKEHIWLHDII